ncbi:MAG: DUF504 domain-containing protein [Gammaproteobacteria bacterium]|nr:DUF504 domain-containing protein [Gammaproteobacteria bacterium]
MIPIHELLSRIRWDPEFGRGEFLIGYLDRLEGEIVLVPLGELRFDPGDRFDFELIDAEGVPRTIPLHRIKAVYRNGERIWRREH